MSLNIAFYSHDSVGLGHARRNRALAWALADSLPRLTGRPTTGLLIAGHPDASQDSLPEGWDWLLLPGFARTREGYGPRALGLESHELADLRSRIVSAALDSLAPDLFVVDRHPFGVDQELKPAIERMKRNHGTTTVLGMRDVLDTPSAVVQEWEAVGGGAAVAELFDEVWVYGDSSAYDPLATGELPAELADRSHFTGFLSRGRPLDAGLSMETPYVLTVVGGGSDGGDIARAAAAAPLPEGHRHLIVTGPQMPAADVESVREAAEANPHQESSPETPGSRPRSRIRVIRSASHVPALIRDAAAVVCMGGYNSVAEVMATSTPALVVPRRSRRAEQPRRAEALAAVGALETVPADQADPQRIGAWIASAVDHRVSRAHLDLNGLREVGRLAAGLLERSARLDPTAQEASHVS